MSAPAEPSSPRPPPAPRPVPRGARSFGASFLTLFGAIWGGVGLVLTLVFTLIGGPFWNDWILDRRCVRADARPSDVNGTASTRNGKRVYEIEFRFADLAGRDFSGTASTTDGAIVASARKGGHVAVEYDPENPKLNRLVGGSASLFGAGGLVPLGFFVVGAGVLAAGLVSTRRSRALYRDGEVAEARVVAVERTSSRQNYKYLVRMRYELSAPSGTVTGEWRTLTPAEVGAAIWVIYDPERPERSIPANV